MKTTLGKYLEALRVIGKEKDICVDGIDCIAYCGTELTPEGEEHFARALALPMYQNEYGENEPCVVSDDDADYDEENENSALALAWEMVSGMAGYCSCADFEKWFID